MRSTPLAILLLDGLSPKERKGLTRFLQSGCTTRSAQLIEFHALCMRYLKRADRLERIEQAHAETWAPPVGSLRKWYYRLSIQIKRYLVWAAVTSDDGRLNAAFFHFESRFLHLRPAVSASAEGVKGLSHYLAELNGAGADLLSRELPAAQAAQLRRSLQQIQALGEAHLEVISEAGEAAGPQGPDTLPLLQALRAYQREGGLPSAALAEQATRLLPGMDPAERAWFFALLLDAGERSLEGKVWESLIRLGMRTGGLCMKGEPKGQILDRTLLRIMEGLLEAGHTQLLSDLLRHFEGRVSGPDAETVFGYAQVRSRIANEAYREGLKQLESLPAARGIMALKLSSLRAMCLRGMGEFDRLRQELRSLMRKTRQATGLSRRFRGGLLVFAEIMMDTARDMPDSVWEYDKSLMDKRKFVYERAYLMRLLAEKVGTGDKV